MADENVDIRTRVIGARQAEADENKVARGARNMGREVRKAGLEMEGTGKRSFLMNQALFTVRRTMYSTTLAATGMAAGVAAMGLKFDIAMESNQVAMTYLLHSETKAKDELALLYDMAAKTPFEFGNITSAARRFLSFGFNINEVNKYLGVTADAIAAMGGGEEMIDRVVRAFGQMRAKGRLMGGELLQLTEAQIPALRYVQEELGLTGDQMRRIGALGIPANVAIKAITTGMARDFGGASEKLANTVGGQLSTLHDYASQLFGEIMMAPFKAIRGSMPQFLALLGTATETMRTQGFMAMVKVWDEGVGAGGKLTRTIQMLVTAGRNFADLFMNVLWPTLRPFVKLIGGTLLIALQLFSHLMYNGSRSANVLVPVLQALIILWVIGAVRVKTLAIMQALETLSLNKRILKGRIANGVLAVQWLWSFRLAVWTKILALQEIRLATITGALTARYKAWVAWTWASNRAANGQFAAGFRNTRMMAVLSRFILGGNRLLKIRTLLTTRLIFTEIRQSRVVAVLTARYKAWRLWALASNRAANGTFAAGFKNNGMFARMSRMLILRVIPAVTGYAAATWAAVTATWAWTLALLANPFVLITLGLVALGIIIFELVRHWDDVTAAVKRSWEWIKRFAELVRHPMRIHVEWSMDRGPGGGLLRLLGRGSGGGAGIAAGNWIRGQFATGGTMMSSGLAIVGERGPEVVHLPGGSRVQPMQALPAGVGSVSGPVELPPLLLHAEFNVDGKRFATAMAEYRLDRKARR